MDKKPFFLKALALVGTMLVLFPVAVMVVTGVIGSLQQKSLLVDVLLPVEFFPVVLAGGPMLLWAALKSHLYRKAVGWTLAALVVLLVGSQAAAVLTGLATGAVQPGGWEMALVFSMLVGFDLAAAALGVLGILVLMRLFNRQTAGSSPAQLG